MAKVIKLKESDITKIVEGILKEQEEFDDFDIKKQPEEFSVGDYHELTLGQDENGKYYVIDRADSNNPKIVAKTK
jgi:ATP-dependent helicase/DNAse subunit B